MSDVLAFIFEQDLSTVPFDYDRYGGFDTNGEPKKVYGAEAIYQALGLWFESFKGEQLRQPRKRGYVIPYIFKPVNDDTAIGLGEAITTGIEQDFLPKLIIQSLQVVPDPARKEYLIRLQATTKDFKIQIDYSDKIKSKQ